MKKNQEIICHDIRGRAFSISSVRLTFRPSVYGVIVNDGKVLLSRQWDGYDFPGGGIELGETIHEALIREVREETGLEVEVGEILTVENSFFKNLSAENYFHSILLYYSCRVIGGKLSAKFSTPEEKSYLGEPEWVDLSKINKVKFYNSVNTEEIINNARRKQ